MEVHGSTRRMWVEVSKSEKFHNGIWCFFLRSEAVKKRSMSVPRRNQKEMDLWRKAEAPGFQEGEEEERRGRKGRGGLENWQKMRKSMSGAKMMKMIQQAKLLQNCPVYRNVSHVA